MLPLYKAIEAHMLKQHDEGSAVVKRMKLPDVFNKRRYADKGKGKLWHPCFSAAYLLDPMHFVQDSDGDWNSNFSKLSEEEEEDEAKDTILRLTPSSNKEAAEEEWHRLKMDGIEDSNLTANIMPHLTQRQHNRDGSVTVATVKRRRKWWAKYCDDMCC
jgi:hypothetical protein